MPDRSRTDGGLQAELRWYEGLEVVVRTLAADRDKRLRPRAVRLLAQLATRESVLAAAEAVVAEKDRALRLEGASALASVQEVLLRSECAELLARGVADKDRDVRVAFASIAARRDDAKALGVLRDEGVTHPDHHFRELAAVALARQGDPAGEHVLVAMLGRDRIPGVDDPALVRELLVREQVELCALLAKLHTDSGQAALERARKSAHEAVRAAAEAALAGW